MVILVVLAVLLGMVAPVLFSIVVPTPVGGGL